MTKAKTRSYLRLPWLFTLAVLLSLAPLSCQRVATGGVQGQSTPNATGTQSASQHIAISNAMLLVADDLARFPGTWCDAPDPLREPCNFAVPQRDTFGLPDCPPSVGRSRTPFQSSEPVTPDPRLLGNGRHFVFERILEFATPADAASCMSVLRARTTASPGTETPISFPLFGDETVAQAGDAPATTKLALRIFVRRANVILEMGTTDGDRAEAYVTIALAKIDKNVAAGSKFNSNATSTP